MAVIKYIAVKGLRVQWFSYVLGFQSHSLQKTQEIDISIIWVTIICRAVGHGVCFAEKVSSLGKDWHRPCLKCEKCSKTLTPGSHAEHDGKPYCNQPCYAALFGPKGFGRGGTESHSYK
uniref:Cysteine-rich protein 1 (intestinal) n=2 Tax=Xenopus tropicalis TaxID=8364 RepID=A0A6I8SFM6_XENTR